MTDREWVEKNYMTVPESIKVFDHWCKHQNINKDDFIDKLWSVLAKEDPKINTFCIVGQPNAGKSKMLRSLQPIAKYYGEIHTSDGSAFNFMNSINTACIFMEEPRITPEVVEQTKLIFEGQRTQVKVKNRDDEWLERTPVIITSNSQITRWCPQETKAINARMHQFFAKTAPFLKHYKRDMNPAIGSNFSHTKLTNTLHNITMTDKSLTTN